jgi:hypothetical protein
VGVAALPLGQRNQRVGQVRLIGGRPVFDADDPERAYGELVHALAELVTADFKVLWVSQ